MQIGSNKSPCEWTATKQKMPRNPEHFSQREPNAIFLQVWLELPELLVLQLLTFLLLS